MQSKFKAGLIVGGVLLAVNFFSGLICQLCPLALSLVAGGLAGWLTIQWATQRPANPPLDGAIAGALAGVGGLVGQLISLVINMTLFASGGFETPFGPTLSNQEEQAIAVMAGGGIWGCGGLVAFVVAAGVGALAAMFFVDKKTFASADTSLYAEMQEPPDPYAY